MGNLPLLVTSRLNDFSESEKRAYFEEFDRKKKSVFVAYILLIPLGWHYAYLKKWGLQILCFLTLWGFLLWWFVDWFRVPTLVENYNKDLSIELLKNFSWVSKKENLNEENSSELKKWLKENPNSPFNGFRKLSALLGLIIGLYGALHFSHFAINFLTEYISIHPLYIKIMAFVLTFIIIVLIIRIVGKVLQKTINFAGLGFLLNRLGGVLFSLLRYLFILAIIFIIIDLVNSKINLFNSSYFNHSIIYQKVIHPIILFIRQLIDSFFN